MALLTALAMVGLALLAILIVAPSRTLRDVIPRGILPRSTVRGMGRQQCPWVTSHAPVEVKVDQVLAQMTLADKVDVLNLFHQPAGWENVMHAVPRLCIPQLTLQDGAAGVAGTRHATQLPAPIAVAASWDPRLARTFGTVQGQESWAKGIDVAQSPNIAIARVPENGRTFEAYGEDPYLTSQMGVADIEGIQGTGVMSDATHYVANNQETHRLGIDELISTRALEEIYLAPFRAAVQQAHVASMMCAYDTVNDYPSCQNSYLLTDVLNHQFGFTGFVRSDAGAVHDATAPVSAAYNAGMDQLKVGNINLVTQLIRSGHITMSRVNDAVRRVLREMFRFRLFTRHSDGLPHMTASTPQHVAIARTIAESGTVLLQNRNGILPLDVHRTRSIAVIGSDGGQGARTRGLGGSEVSGGPIVTPYDGIATRADGVPVTYTSGLSLNAAAKAARAADVAVVFAGDVESEGRDRPNLTLPWNQDALINAVAQANPNTVVVLNTGSAVVMPWLSEVKAVIEAWYPGEQDGNAIAAVLFGDVNPSGKLPLTFPQSPAQTPAHLASEWPGINLVSRYSEGIDVGYRWYESRGLNPLFPFGWGLSYTTFALSHPSVAERGESAITISANVTNTGSRSGAEVVQLYAGLPSSTGEPPRQLKGFAKVFLLPGQSATVDFVLRPSELSYWGAQGWVTAPGRYRFFVGTSSADVVNAGSQTLGSGGQLIG